MDHERVEKRSRATVAVTHAPVNVDYINPFVAATIKVFRVMLRCEIERKELSLKQHTRPAFDISGVIGLTGKAVGTVVLSMEREVAIRATEVMLEQRPSSLDADVSDSIGELTNIVAGNAKAQLERYEMSLTIPTVIIGKNHHVDFPRSVTPIVIPFDCAWGSVCLDVGLCEVRAKDDA
jgi:chemotaxis protein CheX